MVFQTSLPNFSFISTKNCKISCKLLFLKQCSLDSIKFSKAFGCEIVQLLDGKYRFSLESIFAEIDFVRH